MSIFSGPEGYGLRHQYSELLPADLTLATSKATAVLLHRFEKAGRLAFIDTTLRNQAISGTAIPATVQLLLVHEKRDPTADANKLPWIKLEAPRVINYEIGNIPGMEFEPGTRIYAYIPADSAVAAAGITHGALKVLCWG